MLLSGNAEVAFSSGTTTIATANLPDTPTIAAATSTSNVAAVATSRMSALTTTAPASLPTAAVSTTTATCAGPPSTASVSDALAFAPPTTAASVLTPPASQKRKAGPTPTRD
jgi:hypothetical protein